MKRLTSVILHAAAVHIVSCQRAADIGKVNSYLMSSPSFKTDLCKGIFIAADDNAVIGNGPLTVWGYLTFYY